MLDDERAGLGRRRQLAPTITDRSGRSRLAARQAHDTGVIQVAYLVVGRVPFAQDFDGSVKGGQALGGSACPVDFEVAESEQAEDGDHCGKRGPETAGSWTVQ